MKKYFYLILALWILLFFAKEAFALPFIVTPISIPAYVPVGGSATATFNVTNNTGSFHSNIVVRDLPPGVSVDTSTGCGASFSLAAGASCVLTLILTQPVINGFFFVCLDCGDTCAGAALNVPSGPAVYAYIDNFDASPPPIVRCIVDPGTGSLNTCVNAGTTVSLNAPQGLRLNPAKTQLYIADIDSDIVEVCTINPANGLFSSCAIAGNFNAANDLVFAPGGSRVYVSMGLSGSNQVSTCSVNSATGFFSGCVSAGGGAIYNDLFGLAINPGGSIVWVTNFGSQAYYCNVNTSGTFSSCTATNPTNPGGIGVNPNATYAYITTGTTIQRCNIVATSGALTSCSAVVSGTTTGGDPVVNQANTYLYYANETNTITYCSINSGTGALSNCASVNVGTNNTFSIALRE